MFKYKRTRTHILNSRKCSVAMPHEIVFAPPWQLSLSYTQQLAVSDLWCTLLISSWQNNLQQLHTISLSPLGYFSEIYELQAAFFCFVSNLHTRFWKQCSVAKRCSIMACIFTRELHLSIHDNISELFQCAVNRLFFFLLSPHIRSPLVNTCKNPNY